MAKLRSLGKCVFITLVRIIGTIFMPIVIGIESIVITINIIPIVVGVMLIRTGEKLKLIKSVDTEDRFVRLIYKPSMWAETASWYYFYYMLGITPDPN